MTQHASNPADLSAVEARDLIAEKKLSSQELTQACIARVNELDHAVNALVARDFDRALTEAKAADGKQARGEALGPLHGLPFGVKDMVDVAGLPTTFGSEIFRDNIATKDDAMVEAMRSAGALVLGKTNCPEWSAGGNTRNRVYGVTPNPYDLTRNCGGSSGGSAVALACGYTPLATGSDTGGSLRTPASFCGVVGYRPSPGVVPGTKRAMGMMPLPTNGPMGRTVADCGLMLSVIATPDTRDQYTHVMGGNTLWDTKKFANIQSIDLKGLRFAITDDYGFAPVENAVKRCFRKAISTLTPFLSQVEEATPDCSHADRIFSVLRAVMFLSSHPKLLDEHPELMGPNITDNVLEGRTYSAEDVSQALTMQTAYYCRWQDFFNDHDYILAPTTTIQTRNWHEFYPTEIDGKPTKTYYHWLAMAYASTLAGHPSITIPCGRDENGMPFGLQIVGKRHDDAGVLAVASQLEAIIAGISSLAPQRPDFAMLKGASPISDVEGFLSFD
ncbi:amidase [Vibrio nitrifigilis]|uniref:Amidase n=1 Tax=Vibrio nitrifigilis TaxID=2789781 RepID=A0ABS0GLW4_9VIBR|nr:amidase [Vibrio nitrifigilis]MBF9003305.1 amidase [Vibrio nitrifigilis]